MQCGCSVCSCARPASIVYVQNFACGVSNKVKNVALSPLMFIDFTKVTLEG
jgi:hypothetical protein